MTSLSKLLKDAQEEAAAAHAAMVTQKNLENADVAGLQESYLESQEEKGVSFARACIPSDQKTRWAQCGIELKRGSYFGTQAARVFVHLSRERRFAQIEANYVSDDMEVRVNRQKLDGGAPQTLDEFRALVDAEARKLLDTS